VTVQERTKYKRTRDTTHLSFRGGTLRRLRDYADRNYPGHNVISMLADKAVSEWLDRNDNGQEG